MMVMRARMQSLLPVAVGNDAITLMFCLVVVFVRQSYVQSCVLCLSGGASGDLAKLCCVALRSIAPN